LSLVNVASCAVTGLRDGSIPHPGEPYSVRASACVSLSVSSLHLQCVGRRDRTKKIRKIPQAQCDINLGLYFFSLLLFCLQVTSLPSFYHPFSQHSSLSTSITLTISTSRELNLLQISRVTFILQERLSCVGPYAFFQDFPFPRSSIVSVTVHNYVFNL
jgi:hypothetical protein